MTRNDKAVSALIQAGASAPLVSAVMGREDRCVNATIKGIPVRIILTKGKATAIMAVQAHSSTVQTVLAIIGSARCEVRWLAA